MADRVDYFFRQRVSEAELDLGFELLEKADRNLAADLGVYGVISGAVPAPHSPLADLSVDLTAPARAYDNLGQRVFFGTGQTVSCAVDLSGIPTDVSSAGNERWLGIFLRFRRQLSDPRTDGNSQQVLFRRDESFELLVRQAPEGAAGVAPKVALQPDELLVCDVRRRPGQTQIVAADLDTSRRQAFVFAQGSSVALQTGLWSILQPLAATAQGALDEVDAELAEHFGGTGRRHSASAIVSTARGFIAATNLQAALNELVDDLSSAVAGAAGAALVGADAVAGAPNALPAGNVDGQLAAILGFINAHQGAPAGAHNASAIAAAVHSFITATNVQSQLQQIVSSLTSTAAPSGASRVGVVDTAGRLNASDVEAALAEILAVLESGHFRLNEANSGLHRTLVQPDLGSAMNLLWDATGASGSRFRAHIDSEGIWLTLNASWNGAAWVRDQAGPAAALRLRGIAFEVLYEGSVAASFTSWSRTWRLPLASATNSALEVAGSIQEIGRLGTTFSNPYTADRLVAGGGAVTFRSRFPASPSSITLTTDYFTGNNVVPGTVAISRDGFGFFANKTVPADSRWYWMGTYTAVA